MGNLVNLSKRFLDRNAATILTCIGGAGLIATSVLAVKATPKALARVEKVEEGKGEKLTKFEVVKAAAPVYIPAVVAGASTLVCIFGANALNKRKQAHLVSAYMLLENSYKQYRNKVIDVFGKEGDLEVRTVIAKDKYNDEHIVLSEDKQLFYDEFLGEYFEATIGQVLLAENRMNRDLSLQGWATLNEYYELLGFDNYDDGGALGWSDGGNYEKYWQSWIDFGHHKVTMEDGLECIIITMYQEPYMEFEEY